MNHYCHLQTNVHQEFLNTYVDVIHDHPKSITKKKTFMSFLKYVKHFKMLSSSICQNHSH